MIERNAGEFSNWKYFNFYIVRLAGKNFLWFPDVIFNEILNYES